MSKFKAWIAAARLRTLPLSVSGIIVGGSLGNYEHWITIPECCFCCFGCPQVWSGLIFWLAILTTIGFQVISNFANDYGDGVKGTDENRKGEQRMVASGIISPSAMKRGIIVVSILTFLVALLLLYTAFGKENLLYIGIFIVLGVVSIAAAIKYTVGKNAYGYSGLGDLFVFLFFGMLSVLGTYFLFTQYLKWDLLLPATTVGLLSVAVLNLNNMRDIENDALVGKNTIVVKLGRKRAKIYHYVILIVAMLSAIAYTFLNYNTGMNADIPFSQFAYVITFIPLLLNMIKVARNKEPQKLDGELKKVALSTFAFAILFGYLH